MAHKLKKMTDEAKNVHSSQSIYRWKRKKTFNVNPFHLFVSRAWASSVVLIRFHVKCLNQSAITAPTSVSSVPLLMPSSSYLPLSFSPFSIHTFSHILIFLLFPLLPSLHLILFNSATLPLPVLAILHFYEPQFFLSLHTFYSVTH